MKKLTHAIFVASWLLGVLSLVAAIVLRFAPAMETRFNVSARGGIFLSVALFLCALASREMGRAEEA